MAEEQVAWPAELDTYRPLAINCDDVEERLMPVLSDRRDAKVLSQVVCEFIRETRENHARVAAGLGHIRVEHGKRLDRHEGLLRLIALALNIPKEQIEEVLKP